MYKILFNFFYCFYVRRIQEAARIGATAAISIVICVHLLLLLTILRLFTGIDILKIAIGANDVGNKLIMYPIAFLYIGVVSLYFSKNRISTFVSTSPTDYKLLTFKNVVYLLSAVVMPFILLFSILTYITKHGSFFALA